MLTAYRSIPAGLSLVNAVIISPADDLAAKYAWLKSSSRDAAMGALGATNRRTLILTPGVYTLSGNLDLDTDYVDLVGMGAPADVQVVRGTGGAAVTQTADDVRLTFFTIRSTGTTSGDHGFVINATDNSDSQYRFMHFRQANNNRATTPVCGLSHLAGTWEFCEADQYAWRTDTDKNLSATMTFCTAGDNSYGGDGGITAGSASSTGTISGTLRHCVGGDQCFGGCTGYGLGISGTLEWCSAGDYSYALGRTISGMIRWCTGGLSSFAGATGITYVGTISGVVEDCVAEGGMSFGTSSNSSSVVSGIVRRCRYVPTADWTQGRTLDLGDSTITDNSAAASAATDLGSNKDITLAVREAGTWANSYTFDLEYTAIPLGVGVAVDHTNKVILVKWSDATGGNYKDGPYTANQLIALINADTSTEGAQLVDASAAPGDGTGTIGTTDNSADNEFSGGAGGPLYQANSGGVLFESSRSLTLRARDTGQTFTNGKAKGEITFTLPSAVIGLEFMFCRTTETAGCDLNIDPAAADHIELEDGTALSNGEYYANEADAFGLVKLVCYQANTWQVVNEIGTWVQETP